MRRLLLIGLALVLMAGCDKLKSKVAKNNNQPAGGFSTGGGSGGAAQAVRQAVYRTVNMNELNNLRTFIDAASLANGRMPTAAEIKAEIQRPAPKTYQLVESGAIVLTNTSSREGIWAYTADPKAPAGEHLVLIANEIKRMTAQELKQRLQ